MSKELIERLRQQYHLLDPCDEFRHDALLAADEIERLTAELSRVLSELERLVIHHQEQTAALKVELAKANRIGDVHFARTLKQEKELAALKAQSEPVAYLFKDRHGLLKLSQVIPREAGAFPVFTTLQPVQDKDAERYRWLRNEHDVDLPIGRVVWKKGSIQSSACWCDLIDANDLDQHIDAAIAKRVAYQELVAAIDEVALQLDSPQPAQSEPVCKTCNGEGGWEACGSSTNYFWKDCPDCKKEPAKWPASAEVERDAERYRKALEKIADWNGNWGQFPENNPAWRSMALVTARDAVPHPIDAAIAKQKGNT